MIYKEGLHFGIAKNFRLFYNKNQLKDFRNSKGEISVLALNILLKDCEY